MPGIVFKFHLVVGNEESLNRGVRSSASHRVRDNYRVTWRPDWEVVNLDTSDWWKLL